MGLNDFWAGAVLGVTVGLMAGILWEEAYEMIRDAYNERRGMSGNGERGSRRSTDGVRGWARVRGWVRRKTENVTALGVVLILIAVVQIATGLFSVITYTRMGDFISCQANYNQQSAQARKPRIVAGDAETDALYDWLETLPSLLAVKPGDKPDPAQVQQFNDTLEAALKTHRTNVRAKKENPYPPDPDNTCGDY